MTHPGPPDDPAACRDAAAPPDAAGAPGTAGPLAPMSSAGIPFDLLSPGAWFPPTAALLGAEGTGPGVGEACAQGEALLAGRTEEAEARWREIASAATAGRGAATARLGLAVARGLGGDPAAAADALEEVRRAHGADDPLHVLARLNRGAALAAAGLPADGEAAAAEALRAARRIRMPALESAASLVYAVAALTRGRLNEARRRLGEALRGFTREGDALRRVQCHHLLGEIAYEAEDPIKAGAHYRDGLAIARAEGAASAVELLMLRFEHR